MSGRIALSQLHRENLRFVSFWETKPVHIWSVNEWDRCWILEIPTNATKRAARSVLLHDISFLQKSITVKKHLRALDRLHQESQSTSPDPINDDIWKRAEGLAIASNDARDAVFQHATRMLTGERRAGTIVSATELEEEEDDAEETTAERMALPRPPLPLPASRSRSPLGSLPTTLLPTAPLPALPLVQQPVPTGAASVTGSVAPSVAPSIAPSAYTADGRNYFEKLEITGLGARLACLNRTIDPRNLSADRIVFVGEINQADSIRTLFTADEWDQLSQDFEKIDNANALAITALSQLWETVALPLVTSYQEVISKEIDPRKIIETLAAKTYLAANSDQVNEVSGFIQAAFLAMFRAIQRGLFLQVETSEADYRDHLLHHLFEPMFAETTTTFLRYQRGERTNQQRRQQFNEGRAMSERRGQNGWKHDAIIDIRLESQWWHLFFLEVVGSPTLVDDQKHAEDQTKLFKAMQLALFNIRNLLLCRGVAEDKLRVVEAHACIVYQRKLEHFRMVRDEDGLYLVDVVFEASVPDRADEMGGQFQDILEYNLLELKSRMIDMHHKVVALLQSVSRRDKGLKRRRSKGERSTPATPAKKNQTGAS
ncbi:hypothetical protein BC832DRAFT_557265 [Gaertneriomyces semiglobifer]|nr:hypothetical protein BC832DRAFT_557265 [Gaertneriomyces semiglobifer]